MNTMIARIHLLLSLFFSSFLLLNAESQRLLILADMGNEPDEEQQIMHMLMCSNEFDLEGLIAVTGKFLRPEANRDYKRHLHPELFHRLIDGYSLVYENLKEHANAWPTPDHLHSIVASGQKGYGIEDTGTDKSSKGSELIIEVLNKKDPRPIYTVVNAGSNTLAQALKDYRQRYGIEQLQTAISKLRVYENGAQDNAGAWICSEFPSIHWVRSNYQTYCYGGPGVDGGFDNNGNKRELGPLTWEPYNYSPMGQHHWLLDHVISNHGPFGAYYPLRQFPRGGISFMEGGGTIPWLALINKGLSDIDHPYWGGWSGLFTREKVSNVWSKHQSVKVDEGDFAPFGMFSERPDTWTNPDDGRTYKNNIYSPVFRWRRAFVNDFACRMDWCKEPYEKANHHPVAIVDGDKSDAIIMKTVQSGETLRFNASESFDPDGDELSSKWWIYKEAGTYEGEVLPSEIERTDLTINIPNDAAGKEIHLILEIKDESEIFSLYDYRRIVLKVE